MGLENLQEVSQKGGGGKGEGIVPHYLIILFFLGGVEVKGDHSARIAFQKWQNL